MQALSNFFFKAQEAPPPQPKTDWGKVVLNGSAALITSVAIYAISVGTTYSTALMLSAITGIVLPGSIFFLLYPATLLATYGVDRIAKPFFEKAFGITLQETEVEKPAQPNYRKAAGYLALGVITSFALWSLATVGAVFATGLTMRLVCGIRPGLDLGRLFYILIVAPLAGGFLSIPVIHQVAGPYFHKAKELSALRASS